MDVLCEIETDLNMIKANLDFDRLQAMRAASPTGGALGQVSELELKLLESAMQAINQKLSPEEFKLRLLEVKRLYSQIRDEALKDYAYAMATTTNAHTRGEYDKQMNIYQAMIDGTIDASDEDKETAQKIINQYNSISDRRSAQGLQGGGLVSLDPVVDSTEQESDLDYLNSLRSEIASLQGAGGQ